MSRAAYVNAVADLFPLAFTMHNKNMRCVAVFPVANSLLEQMLTVLKYYVQAVTKASARRIVGSSMSLEDEDSELYKSALFSPQARCLGPGHCSNPLMFKACMQRAHKSKPAASYKQGWRAQVAKLRVLAEKAHGKSNAERKHAVIHDVSTCKQYFDPATDDRQRWHSSECTLFRLTLCQLLIQKLQLYDWQLVALVHHMLGWPTGQHPKQLHLDEFCAMQSLNMIENMALQALAAKKPLQTVTTDDAVEDDLSDNLEDASPGRQVEFLGGAEDNAEEDLDDEFLNAAFCYKPEWSCTAPEVHDILQRTQERNRLIKPGRKRESDVHQQKFFDLFADVLEAPLPQASQKISELKYFHAGESEAEMHQKAVATLLRRGHEQGSSPDVPPDYETLMQRNHFNETHDAECCVVDMPNADPKTMTWHLLQKNKMNNEQVDAAALIAWPVQRSFDLQQSCSADQPVPLVGPLARLLIVGGGGCGKTTLLLRIIEPIVKHFIGPLVKAAPSNKAAREIGGRTMHTLSALRATTSFRTAALALKKDEDRKKLLAVHGKAGGEALDEFSQIMGALLHAYCLRATYARALIWKLQTSKYADQDELCGKIPVFLMLGDHLQMPPVPKSASLLAPLDEASDEHKCAAAIFSRLPLVFELKQAMRFNDPMLVSILAKMRKQGGSKLTEEEWSLLQKTCVAEQCSQPAAEKIQDWYHSCYLWAIVTMIAPMLAKLSAKRARRTLFVCQAVDKPNRAFENLSLIFTKF